MFKTVIITAITLTLFQGCFFAKWYEDERFSAFQKGSHRSEIVSQIGIPTKSYQLEENENGERKTVDIFYFRDIKDSQFQVDFAEVTPNGIFTIRQPKMEFHYAKITYNYDGIAENIEFSGEDK